MKTSWITVIPIVAAVMGLAACTSSPSGVATQATTAVAEAAEAAPSAEPTAPADSASTVPAPVASTCPEFLMTAAHMATDWHYLSINLGTTNDETPTMQDLAAGVMALQALAPECAPEAVDSISQFAATVDDIQSVYTTQPTGAEVQQVDDALAAMQEAGIRMFTDLGQSPDYAWQ